MRDLAAVLSAGVRLRDLNELDFVGFLPCLLIGCRGIRRECAVCELMLAFAMMAALNRNGCWSVRLCQAGSEPRKRSVSRSILVRVAGELCLAKQGMMGGG